MAMEKWIAIAGIALCVMFVGMIITIYQFMNEPTIDTVSYTHLRAHET